MCEINKLWNHPLKFQKAKLHSLIYSKILLLIYLFLIIVLVAFRIGVNRSFIICSYLLILHVSMFYKYFKYIPDITQWHAFLYFVPMWKICSEGQPSYISASNVLLFNWLSFTWLWHIEMKKNLFTPLITC